MHVSGLAYVSAVAAEAKKRCPNPPRAGVVVSCPTWVLGTLKNLTPGLERTIFTNSYTQNMLCTFYPNESQQPSSNDASEASWPGVASLLYVPRTGYGPWYLLRGKELNHVGIGGLKCFLP